MCVCAIMCINIYMCVCVGELNILFRCSDTCNMNKSNNKSTTGAQTIGRPEHTMGNMEHKQI